MLVYGNDVSFVLEVDGISGFVAPSCIYDCSVQGGLYHRTFRCGDIYERMPG